jgi:hypothetical protein
LPDNADGGPVYGRQAIEKWYADMFQQFHPSNFKEKADQDSPYVVGATGNEACRIGEWSQTVSGKRRSCSNEGLLVDNRYSAG